MLSVGQPEISCKLEIKKNNNNNNENSRRLKVNWLVVQKLQIQQRVIYTYSLNHCPWVHSGWQLIFWDTRRSPIRNMSLQTSHPASLFFLRLVTPSLEITFARKRRRNYFLFYLWSQCKCYPLYFDLETQNILQC